MNDVQYLIDRQLGFCPRPSYDNVLKRLVVREQDSFHGLAPAGVEDTPIFACRFAELPHFEHILALANEDGRVAIQDTSKPGALSPPEGYLCHNNAVFDLTWMPGYMNFVTVSGDHTACLWDVTMSGPRKLLTFQSHTRSVKTAVFRPDEPSVFATGARDGHILVWDIRNAHNPSTIYKPDNCLMNCHSSFNPKTPGSHGKRPRFDLQLHRAISITGLVFQDDYTLISCGECDGNIKVWDLRKNYNNHIREPLAKHTIPYCGSSTKNGYTNLIVDNARVRLYASCMDNVIYCFNISTYSNIPEQRYVGHENSTFYIKTGLSPDSRYLVSGSSDKHAYIWNVRRSQPLVRLAGHWAEVTCATWAKGDSPALVTCSDDARHKIWRVGGEDELTGLQGRAEEVPQPQQGLVWQERTPATSSAPKRAPSPQSQPRQNPFARSKRCLATLLGARPEQTPPPPDHTPMELARSDPAPPEKRPRLEQPTPPSPPSPPLLRAGHKRPAAADWQYATPHGTSFLSPTKRFEKRFCRTLSPRSPRSAALQLSPAKSPPTKDLPDFVRTGEAPHLRLMSPPLKRKASDPDWLTAITLNRRARLPDRPDPISPHSPKEPPPRRASQSAKKPRTLLKYFTVANRKDCL